jgi:glycerophosphoryl diester phosphodiesterase
MTPRVIAHRGAAAEQPENTLLAFRRALALGVDAIELDVQVSRDGVPVVFHDASLHRLTGIRDRIARRTWPELRVLRVRGLEPIPRLTEVLRFTRGRVVVQIELKAGVPVAPVVQAIVTARAMKWVVLASFLPGSVRLARQLAPTVPRMLISEGRSAIASLVRQLAALGAGGLSVNHRAVRDAAWLRRFQSRGFAVWCWTVNEPTRMQRLAEWGADGILSDDPALLVRTLSGCFKRSSSPTNPANKRKRDRSERP